jgi:hypothetical protein
LGLPVLRVEIVSLARQLHRFNAGKDQKYMGSLSLAFLLSSNEDRQALIFG